MVEGEGEERQREERKTTEQATKVPLKLWPLISDASSGSPDIPGLTRGVQVAQAVVGLSRRGARGCYLAGSKRGPSEGGSALALSRVVILEQAVHRILQDVFDFFSPLQDLGKLEFTPKPVGSLCFPSLSYSLASRWTFKTSKFSLEGRISSTWRC